MLESNFVLPSHRTRGRRRRRLSQRSRRQDVWMSALLLRWNRPCQRYPDPTFREKERRGQQTCRQNAPRLRSVSRLCSTTRGVQTKRLCLGTGHRNCPPGRPPLWKRHGPHRPQTRVHPSHENQSESGCALCVHPTTLEEPDWPTREDSRLHPDHTATQTPGLGSRIGVRTGLGGGL